MNLLDTIRRGAWADSSLSWNQYQEYFNFNGSAYPFSMGRGTLTGTREEIGSDFVGVAQGAYRSNGVVFACMLVRQMLFSEARVQFRQVRNGRPGKLFGNADLELLERPWKNGTTGGLLSRMIQDADLAGNFFATPRGVGANKRIKRMRPDWVTIVMGSMTDPAVTSADLDADLLGYIYHPYGGHGDPTFLLPEDVAHFAPIPDPIASYRGMSWLTPIIREIMADGAMTTHKIKYMEQGATANMVVTLDKDIKREQFEQWIELFEERHTGYLNAYKTLYLGGGSDATVVGNSLEQINFKEVQGAGEPLALDTPLPTPTGWTTMGDVKVGDRVFGRDGRAIDVVGVLDTHADRECYRVTFNDRTSIVADASHIWRVIDRTSAGSGSPRRRHESDQTTVELFSGIAEWGDRGGNRYGVPPVEPVELPERDLLIDPYVLGAWLGDGATAGAAVCGVDPDLSIIQDEFERRGYSTHRWNTAPDKASVFGVPGGLLAALDAIGVFGDKHIPIGYLRASKVQRLDLLRGLMDTDGTVGHVGKETCEYSSKLEGLAEQVAELARSLGYRTTVSSSADARSRTGYRHRVTFRANPQLVPFFLPRKAARCQTAAWVKNRAIVSIEPVESVPVRCIAVDSADHLFCAGKGWVLTHNTRIAAAAGVPPVIVGLSEGLAAATYANYGQARRRLTDGTMRPLWREAMASLAPLVTVPGDAELWYDARDIAFLQEDAKDDAVIKQTQAATIRSLIDAGYKPDSVVDAVQSGDFSQLVHTGLYSVQLQPPTTSFTPNSPNDVTSHNGNGNGSAAALAALTGQ